MDAALPEYCAPASDFLTELHIRDAGAAVTRCGRPYDRGALWMPVEQRPGDQVCAGCAGLAGPAPEPEQLSLL